MWLSVFSLSLVALSHGRTIYPVIPSDLKECYNNTWIITKENLLPMTSTTLIAIIRKLEDSLSSSLGLRTLTPAILNRFRFDGIERNPEVQMSSSIIPFTVKGSEFSLFKTQFEKIVAQTTGVIPNGTLTYIERCTLHAMLSDTIDVWDRGDDTVCNQLSTTSKWRVPREIAKLGDAEVFDPKEGPKTRIVNEEEQNGDYQQMMAPLDSTYTISSCPLEDGVIYNEYGSFSSGIVLAGIAAGTNYQSVSTSYFSSSNWLRRRNQNGQGSFNVNGYPSNSNRGSGGGGQWSFPGQGGYRPSGGNGGGGYNRGIGGYRGGYYVTSATASTPTDIDNRYGATLAGSLALVALLLGPEMGTSMIIGEAGGWNSTTVPKYYFLKDYSMRNALTDARIRGSIDGLLISQSVQNWLSSDSSLKLSQILHMYYSSKGVFSTSLKACSRQSNYQTYTSQLSDQVYAFATLLQDDVATSAQLGADAISYFSSVATQALSTYIQTLSDTTCSTNTYFSSPAIGDVTIAVDCNWTYKKIMAILQTVADKIEMWKYGSNMTLVNAKDGSVMVESMNSSIDLQQRFNYTYYKTVSVGFDYPKTLSMMKQRYRMKQNTDKYLNSAGGYPRILIFMPSSTVSLSTSDSSSALNTLTYFNTSLPNVRILYVTTGSRNTFSPFVGNPYRDIIVLSTSTDIKIGLQPLIYQISNTTRRIINPTCGSNWTGSSYNQVSLNGYLNPRDVHFYRIHQNYFFRNANAVVKITSVSTAPTLTICKSRTFPNPMQNTTSTTDTACQQLTAGNTYQFTISDSICSSVWYAYECNPIYLSISPSSATVSTVSISANCNDAECLDPDMIKYTISHSGLTCYSSAAQLTWSSVVLLLALTVKFFVE